MLRRWPNWPAWICVAVDQAAGRSCCAPARWQRSPTARSRTTWTYCDRHKPAGAAPIPPDAPYRVTRLEIAVAVTGAPGDPEATEDEAIRRITYALEEAGGLVAGIRVRGRKPSTAAVAGSPLRLQLAGPPEPLRMARAAHSRPYKPGTWSRRHSRAS